MSKKDLTKLHPKVSQNPLCGTLEYCFGDFCVCCPVVLPHKLMLRRFLVSEPTLDELDDELPF